MTTGRVVSDLFSDGVDVGSLEDAIEPWPGGRPVRRFDEALGLKIAH